jgi:hypothetical protein
MYDKKYRSKFVLNIMNSNILNLAVRATTKIDTVHDMHQQVHFIMQTLMINKQPGGHYLPQNYNSTMTGIMSLKENGC